MTRFGVYLPNVAWESLPAPSEVVEYAAAAGELGFDSVWVEDRFLHSRVGILEALTTLAFVASRTQRVRLGTCIPLANLRNPLSIAKAVSTLDYLSGGRVILGTSLGGSPPEYGTAGVVMKSRVTRFGETIRALRAPWGEGGFEGVHRLFRPTDVAMWPAPVQSRLPVWIGGKAEPVFRRVATLGDGWLASSTTGAGDFASGWARVREEAVAGGRDPAELEPAKFCYVHVDDSAEKGLALLQERLPRYYPFEYDARGLTIYGPPGRCVEQARQLLEAGVRTLIFSTVTAELAQLRRLSQQVLPELAAYSR